MSASGTRIGSNSKAPSDIPASQASVSSLNRQLCALNGAVGRMAHSQGVDCGHYTQRVEEALAGLQEARKAVEEAQAAFEFACPKEKVAGTQRLADVKVTLATVETRVEAVYQALGDHIMATGVLLPGIEQRRITAEGLRKLIRDRSAQSEPGFAGHNQGRRLMALVAALLLICGVGWLLVTVLFRGNSMRRPLPQ